MKLLLPIVLLLRAKQWPRSRRPEFARGIRPMQRAAQRVLALLLSRVTRLTLLASQLFYLSKISQTEQYNRIHHTIPTTPSSCNARENRSCCALAAELVLQHELKQADGVCANA